MSNFIKIYDKIYNANSITKIDKYNHIPEFLDLIDSYDIRIWFKEGRCEFIEFKTEEERDLEFNKIN